MPSTTSATVATLIGASPPDSTGSRVRLAFFRALRTLIQGIAGAFPAAGAGTVVVTLGFWEAFGYSCLSAVIVAFVSFLQNVAAIFPTDPTQKAT